MARIARMGFDDEAPRLLVQMTPYAVHLLRTDPVEFGRVMRVLSEQLDTYRDQVNAFAAGLDEMVAADLARTNDAPDDPRG